MELFPMKVHANAGELVSFACAYFSSEQLDIEIEVLARPGSEPAARALGQPPSPLLGSVQRDTLRQFPWGGRRALSLAVNAAQDRVKCRVTSRNALGAITMGELTSHIYVKSSGSG